MTCPLLSHPLPMAIARRVFPGIIRVGELAHPLRQKPLREWAPRFDWAAQWSWVCRHGCGQAGPENMRAGRLALPPTNVGIKWPPLPTVYTSNRSHRTSASGYPLVVLPQPLTRAHIPCSNPSHACQMTW